MKVDNNPTVNDLILVIQEDFDDTSEVWVFINGQLFFTNEDLILSPRKRIIEIKDRTKFDQNIENEFSVFYMPKRDSNPYGFYNMPEYYVKHH